MRHYGLMFLMVVTTLTGRLVADETGDSKQTRKGESPRQQVDRIFNENSPAIGHPLPNLACLDAEGNEFQLAQLKGKYTVLLFGCLT